MICLNVSEENIFKMKCWKIEENSKFLYKLTGELCGLNTENPFPDHASDSELAEEFADFFINKIKNIRDKLQDKHKMCFKPDTSVPQLLNYEEISSESVRKIIMDMQSKSCESDPINTKLLKKSIEEFLPSITKLINISLTEGVFARKWKTAILRPLLKKIGLDLICKNYRPVSNLPFLSKVVEKIVTEQVLDHCFKHDLYPDHQSAYVKNRSCETAILNLVNNILWSMERKKIEVVVALDLSAAFDTVDHDILLDLLQNKYRLGGTALKWFDSYLRPRDFQGVHQQSILET